MRDLSKLLALAIMLAGTYMLASLAREALGTVGFVIVGVFGLLITATTLRL